MAVSLARAGGSDGAATAPPSPAGLDGARSTVSKWIATQQLIFKERKDWQEQKEMLQARIAATEREIAALEAKLDESTRSLSELALQQNDRAAAERKLLESSQRMTDAVTALEAEVQRLCRALPAPVLEKVAPLRGRIPADPESARTSIAERLQNVVGILNEMHKANGEISLVTEVRPLSDGKPSEVKTVYIGLGQAYFLSAMGEAGVGRPAAEGWEWQAANELAPRVNEVIEMLENKAQPGFVPLPVTIR